MSSFQLSPEVVSAAAAVGALGLLIKYVRRDSRLTPPGPRPLPIVGNLLNMPAQEQWLVYEEWSRRYGMFRYYPRNSTVIERGRRLRCSAYECVGDGHSCREFGPGGFSTVRPQVRNLFR